VPYLWNPFSVPAALRIPAVPGGPGAVDVLCALAFARTEAEDVWRVQVLRRAAGATAWQHRTLSDAGVSIDPLPGVLATTRSDQSLEVFVVDDTGLIAGARRDPDRFTWSPLAPLALPGPVLVPPPVRRTNRPAVVSRDAGVLDLFWAGPNGLVQTISSPAPGQWGNPVQIGSANVVVHPLANLVAVSRDADHIDVLFLGSATGTTPWLLQVVSWTRANGWAAATTQIGGAAVVLEPLAAIAVGSRNAAVIDAFVVGDNGGLYTTSFDQVAGAWTALAAAGGQPPVGNLPLRLASVDGVVSQGANDVEVVASARDGSVWATHWDNGLAAYTVLDRVTPLDLV
jgi:hypothetical protein